MWYVMTYILSARSFCSVSMFRSVPFRSVPFLEVARCVLYLHSFILVSGLSLFRVPSEYLQTFLGIPDTGILPDTTVTRVICHDSP
jgi:hypothetical protein